MSIFRIIYDEPGQTCNRFWSYLESVSWAILKKRKVIILFWDPSILDYDSLRKSRYVSFPLYRKFLIHRYGEEQYLNMLRGMFARPKALRFYSSGKGKRLGFLNGWAARESDVYFPQVENEVRKIFCPNKSITERVEARFRLERSECDVIVGVHIRRGDYREWRSGKYFYSYQTYHIFMKQIANLFPKRKVSFYLASNEVIPSEVFSDFKEFHSIGRAADDLYALQQCDYIIGPPSTFSKWASIMGNTPLFIIYDKNDSITSIDEFSPLVSHTHFQNGKTIW